MNQLVNPPPPPLTLRELSVSYGKKTVIRSVSAIFPPKSIIAIVGPNGAGKSTLIKAALEIVPRLSGQVSIFGEPPDRVRDRVAYVPQRMSVNWDFPTRVIDVVLMGLYRELGLLGFVRAHHLEVAYASLERVGMEMFAKRQIGQLSGGQQQRVFLARALARRADLYFLDEPFAGVDAMTEKAVVHVLKSLKEEGKTIVCVHHDLSTVQDYFDYVLLLNVSAIAEGPTETTFTRENIATTYGMSMKSDFLFMPTT